MTTNPTPDNALALADPPGLAEAITAIKTAAREHDPVDPDETHCVCGQPWGEPHAAAVLARAAAPHILHGAAREIDDGSPDVFLARQWAAHQLRQMADRSPS